MAMRRFDASSHRDSVESTQTSGHCPVWAAERRCEYIEGGGTKLRVQNADRQVIAALTAALPFIRPMIAASIEAIDTSAYPNEEEHFFGHRSPDAAKTDYQTLLKKIDTKTIPIEYEDRCKPQKAGYVYQGMPSDIHLCPTILDMAPEVLAGWIIHEMSHLYCQTDDHAYIDIGTLSNKKAQDNASSYQGFADTILYLQLSSKDRRTYQVNVTTSAGHEVNVRVENATAEEAELIASQIVAVNEHCQQYKDIRHKDAEEFSDVFFRTCGDINVKLMGTLHSGYDCDMKDDGSFSVSIPWLRKCAPGPVDPYLSLAGNSMYEAVVRGN